MFVVLTIACTGVLSTKAVVIVAQGMPNVMLVLVGAMGLGLVLSKLLLPGDTEKTYRWISVISLGLGGLSLLVLAGGSFGFTGKLTWRMVLIALTALATVAVFMCWLGDRKNGKGGQQRKIGDGANASANDCVARLSRWLWLLAVPFAAVAILLATFPPGILWPAEGNGYDVLEYHFGAPRDWLDAGQITFLPNNIYSNFPMNVEMIYLLSMIVSGDAVSAAVPAQLLNVAMAMLAVGAVYLAAREVAPRSALLAAIVMASCPFVTYLCGVAYVENGLLLFSAMALAAMLRANRAEFHATRWIILSGVFAGMACGCKYTGVPAVLLPLALAAGLRRTGAARRLAAFMLPAMLVLSPWLIRNAINTGNPVFPLARSIMPERAGVWSADGAARWHEGHLPAPEDRPIGRRLQRLWTEVVWSPLFGASVILVVPAAAFFFYRRRRIEKVQEKTGTTIDALAHCWLMILIGLTCWIAFTHLVGRFAIALVPPGAVIFAATFESLTGRGLRRVATVVVIFVATINAALLADVCSGGHVFELSGFGAPGASHWFTGGDWPTHAHVPKINSLTSRGASVLIVADARRYYLGRGVDYCVVFNNNPFAEAAERLAPIELLGWLRNQGYGYVLVNWSEMRRLRNSRYGFWKSIDEELFGRLEVAGLKRVEDFQFVQESNSGSYATLFQLPPAYH